MADVEKVFLSWSGDRSKVVASALHRYLPVLTDRAEPFMSEVDIEAGQRGLREIESALEGARFGIIVVTPENHERQWLNFEAGALSRAVSGEARVVPLLVGMSRPTDLSGPLSQFQAQVWGRQGIRNLFSSLGNVLGLKPEVIDDRIEPAWEKLEAATAKAIAHGPAPQAVKRSPEEMLEELLELTRAIHRDGRTSGLGATVDAVVPVTSFAEKVEVERYALLLAEELGMPARKVQWGSRGTLEIEFSEVPSKRDVVMYTNRIRNKTGVRAEVVYSGETLGRSMAD